MKMHTKKMKIDVLTLAVQGALLHLGSYDANRYDVTQLCNSRGGCQLYPHVLSNRGCI